MNYWIVTASVEFTRTKDNALIAKVKMPLSQLQNGKICGSTRVDRLPDDLLQFAKRLMAREIEGILLRRVRVRTLSGEVVEHQHSIEGDYGDPVE